MSDHERPDSGENGAHAPYWADLTPPYTTIVADPPWPFRWSGGIGGLRRKVTRLSYSLMTLDHIQGLPVGDLAAPAAHLWLWATPEMNRLGQGVAVAEAWGFDVIDEIIWEKPNFGVGVMPRHCHEPLLLCRRGGLPFGGPRDVRSVQKWTQPRTTSGKAHSAKPDAALDLVEQVSPGPYVELFARRPRLGWDHWGYGYEIGAVS